MDATGCRHDEDAFTAALFEDPYPAYVRFREMDPVLELPFNLNLNLDQSETFAGDDNRTWELTRHAAVADALRDGGFITVETEGDERQFGSSSRLAGCPRFPHVRAAGLGATIGLDGDMALGGYRAIDI